MRETILAGLAEILEVDTVTPETELHNSGGGQWDSLAIVSTIAFLDERGVEASGEALMACETAADVLKLAGVET